MLHKLRSGLTALGIVFGVCSVIAMLATTSLGGIWSSCSPDFGTQGVVDRLGQVRPKVLFAAESYSYNGREHDCTQRIEDITEAIGSIERVVLIDYLEPSGTSLRGPVIRWQQFRDPSANLIDFAQLPFEHPLYILFSSGTTGVPKCITHGAGGTLLQHLKEHVLHCDLGSEDRIGYFTTCGWMMWNWLASALGTGAAIALYEGSPFYPHPARMFDFVVNQKLTVFGTGAKMISSWEKAGIRPVETHDIASLRTLLSTGSPLAPEGFDYV